MRKIGLFLILIALTASVLTGCAGAADTLATPTPGMTITVQPESATKAPDASSMTTSAPESGIRTVEDAKRASEAMEDAVDKLSEIKDAQVAVIGDTALVGVTFTDQYQGKVDDRLKKMVLARVQTVDKSVVRVAVTADKTLVDAIEKLEDALEKAPSLDDVKDDLKDLAERITVFTE